MGVQVVVGRYDKATNDSQPDRHQLSTERDEAPRLQAGRTLFRKEELIDYHLHLNFWMRIRQKKSI